ncbi:dipeptidase [Sphingomonas psychrotolerans]|uniref:Dipeptidase n=1 Tax=Sphingomonas psychrotolerans TaxID=1327635 RepID=A0ABU3N4Y6_9SPHN|nr:membrane dipeptidase [Sphingomonas psychrotolerans]MDT8759595.1 dipeptidase [Sphingomonas psychrotolerans]
MQSLPKVSRRRMLGGAAAVAAAGFPMVNFGQFRLSAASPATYSRRAVDLVRASLVIDMLGALKIDESPQFYGAPLSAQDEADWRACGIGAIHHASGMGGPNARTDTLEWIALSQGYIARASHLFTLVDKAADLDRAKKQGKIAVILGLQNSEHFRTVADVKLFHQIGQRCSQLTYNTQNLLGSGSTERVDGGVTDFGAEIVKAMNETGMLVDVSHCGDRTTLDAIALSAKPIAITHSNCRALVNHPRLKTDEAIKAMAAKEGVMGITGVRMFVSAKEPTAVPQIADHIDHVVKLVGIDHVGIGSDSDLNGYDDMPPAMLAEMKAAYKASYAFRDKVDTDGFDHPRKIYDLTEELIRRNYSDADIAAVLGGNFRRLLGQVWGG